LTAMRSITASFVVFPLVLAPFLLFAALPDARAAEALDRQRVSLDADWRFQQVDDPELVDMVLLHSWRWRADRMSGGAALDAGSVMDTSGPEWKTAATGDDVFQGRVGFAWYRADLPDMANPRRLLRFNNVDNNATVYLNGRKLAYHVGCNVQFDVGLDSAWKPGGPNNLAVLVQNEGGPGGILAVAALGHLAADRNLSTPPDNDPNWRIVHLPHDYVVGKAFTELANSYHGSLPVSRAWYRRSFTLPSEDAGKSLWIDIDGVYRDCVVDLNGHRLGRHASGYTLFRYDLHQWANFGGTNVLDVLVDPRQFEGWWYEGGGIYRHVWLNKANRLHVAPWGTFITVDLPEPKPGSLPPLAGVRIQTTLANDDSVEANVTLNSKLLDDTGRVAGISETNVTVPAHGHQEITQNVIVRMPRLWSLERPRLYRLVTDLRANGKTVDQMETPFGISTIRFDVAHGFFLNGQPVKIHGMCNHQDFAGIGIAVPDTMEYWRVEKLKEMGANAWRMSHNPPTPELLDACDRLGMLVMDENRHLGDSEANLSDLISMLQRDRNHPSIIMWSMCNEEQLQGATDGAKIFQTMEKVVREYDTTRPVTSAMSSGWFDPGFATVEDLMGVNYSPSVYDRFHLEHPAMPMFASETASTQTTRGEYADSFAKVSVSSYHMTDGTWQPVAERPFMAGSFVWTGFDYKGEPGPYGWPCINSQYGVMDMCGFPKDNYYYYQSWWKTNPIVHLMPHWNWPGKEGQEIRVIVFANTERVELFQEGHSLGIKEMPRYGHLEWRVKYAPGTLFAKGLNGDTVAATDTVETTGAPASLRLKPVRTTLTADGEDLVPVEVDVLDAQGRIVPTADNLVTFAVHGAGTIAGAGNGNPGDHDPDKADYRHAFNGKCMVIVGAGEKAGAIQLKATAGGLKPATLKLRAVGPAPSDALR
jgi:beta-galactosidase